MAATASKVGRYAERLAYNDYVQEQLANAATNLRDAAKRAQGRKAKKAAQDKKLQNQVKQAALSLKEAGSALKTGREKPKKSFPTKRFVMVLTLGGAAAMIGTNDQLRTRLMGMVGQSGNGNGSSQEAVAPSNGAGSTASA